jgi:hypothetical protein
MFLIDFNVTFINESLGVSTVKTNQDRDFSMCRDKLFETDKIFSTVVTNFLTAFRSRALIETTSRQIETPKLKLKAF